MTGKSSLREVFGSEFGQSIIEFAFTIPIVLLLFFGLMDFGRAAYAAAVVQWAAQEGAHIGTINSTNVEEAARARMVGLNADQAVITMSYPQANTVMVNVSYPFEFATPMIAQIAGESINLQGTASMVVQPAMVE